MNITQEKPKQQAAHFKTWSDRAEVLATYGGIDSSSWKLGILSNLDDANLTKMVSELSANTDVSNPFFDIPFLSASASNLDHQKKQFLFLSEVIGEHEKLKMFAPIVATKEGILKLPVLKVWTHLYGPLGVPLVDAHDERTIDALIECLRTAEHKTATTIMLDMIPKQSLFQQKLYISSRLSSVLHRFSHTTRAALKPGKSKDYFATRLSGKRKQRLKKGMQELSSFGKVSFGKVTSAKEIMTCLEEFLLLESSGWKGKQGTSLETTRQTSIFAHQALQNMASKGKCTIYSLRVDQKAIASLIVFSDKGYFFPWKIAHDENYEKYSPGNNLVAHVNQELYSSKGFKGLDSLAAEDNSTARTFWPDEQELYSMIIGIGKNGERDAALLAREVYLKKRLKDLAKSVLNRIA